MKDFSRIQEINQILESFIHKEFIAILFVLTCIVFIIMVFTNNKLVFGAGILYCCLFIGALVYDSYTIGKLEDELAELEVSAKIDVAGDTKIVQSTKILEKVAVEKKYCPHTELKNSETCTYLEFLSDGEITQVFIPLDRTIYADKENPISIEYLEAPHKDMVSLYEYFNFERTYIDGKHKIYKNYWALGTAIK